MTEAHHRFVAVDQAGRSRALVRELAADRGLTLVFVRTKRGADRLARTLKAEGFHAGALHGGMTQPARERALGRFAAGANDVLVATDVAARGLDLEHITHVINFDPPADEKDYLHRVGRTARAGRSGTGITFVTPEKTGGRRTDREGAEAPRRIRGRGSRVDAPRPRSDARRPRPRPRPARRGR